MGKIKILIIALLVSSCAGHKNSYQLKGEKVIIELKENDCDVNSASAGSVSGLIIPDVINWSFKFINTQFEKEKEKYTQTYSVKRRDESFYCRTSSTSDIAALKYSGFSVTRTIDGNKDTLASKIDFEFDVDETNKFLTIEPTSIVLNKSKAKIKNDDTTLDVVISVKIFSTWSQDDVSNSKEIINCEFKLDNIKLGEIDRNTNKPKVWKIEDKKSDWLAAPPFSSDSSGEALDNGKFVLQVNITEVDDYGKRVEKYAKKFKDNEDLLKKLLKEFIDSK